MPAANAAALLRRNAADPAIAGRPAIHFGERSWTHAEYFTESCRWAELFTALRPRGAPFHVGVLLDNIPEYLFAFGVESWPGGGDLPSDVPQVRPLPRSVGPLKALARWAGHADVRWHLWIVLAALGRLDVALVAYAAYFPARAFVGAVRKAAQHA